MAQKIMPDVIGEQNVLTLVPDETALEAAKVMGANRISAVLVVQDNRLIGIVTERDLAKKVLAGGLDPETTKLSEIMTQDPDTLSPDDSPINALELMSNRGYRHLPVVKGENLVGMVSIRDLYSFVKNQLEEDIRQRDAFIFETGYGAGG